jgi:hypothetical protein
LAATHIAFYREHLEPNAKTIRRAYLESTGVRELLEELNGLPSDRALATSQPVRSAIAWGLERWLEMLDQDELNDWASRGFAIETAFESIDIPWFQPDRWLENMALLRPLLLDRPVQSVQDHVRLRLTEVYRAFTFGLWMSAIALCRSLTEFALKQNAPRLGIAITHSLASGVLEEKTFKHLSDDVCRLLPDLCTPLRSVRQAGNRILHPKGRHVIAFPHVMREEALDCIRATQTAVERLYLQVVAEGKQ